ncbi:unnamed protein product [Clonostachys chloroleuca]|uniref:Zn(2)-C6 fungal-type domain-containing protein n=1 Tax=Clonostachys chloroleuca TaxID=1926264 RepID=A0AA35PVB5_9HYPO|nr:unnamed protein product [Clonostachys chloroleuca]
MDEASDHMGAASTDDSPGDSVASSIPVLQEASWVGAPTNTPPVTKRLQVPRACDRCKRLRRGCSGYRPCRRCIESGLANECRTRMPQPRAALSASVPAPGPQLAELLSSRVIDYCTERFFDRLHPTIPILTMDYVASLRATAASPDAGLESLCVLAGMACQVLLQTEEPESLFQQGVIPDKNLAFGRLLLEMLISTYQNMSRRSPISLETCLVSFFLYACEAVLSHHGRSFRYLRETTTLMILFRPEGTNDTSRLIMDRLFWVLLVSERSHAIRYRRPVTLQITKESPTLDSSDPSLVGFWSLAALFRPIDTSFVALLNRETLMISPTPDSLNRVELEVNSALRLDPSLHDTQKANLRVTQLWLRVIIWQLRLHLGYLVEESHQRSLTFRYPIDVARELVLSTRDLPTSSFSVHGMGMTEKLFDVASSLVDVLARIPLTPTYQRGIEIESSPKDDLSYLRSLISRLPGGADVYDDLLEKHIQQTLPSLEMGGIESLTMGNLESQ